MYSFLCHLFQCFSCATCRNQLVPGDRFHYVNGTIFCEHDRPGAALLNTHLQSNPVLPDQKVSTCFYIYSLRSIWYNEWFWAFDLCFVGLLKGSPSLPSSRNWSFDALTVLKPKFTDLRVSLRWRRSLGRECLCIWLHIKPCWILLYLSWWYCGFLAPSPPENRSSTSIFSQDILSVSHLTSQRRLHLTAVYTLKSTWNCIHNLFFRSKQDIHQEKM